MSYLREPPTSGGGANLQSQTAGVVLPTGSLRQNKMGVEPW
jgi:hypothetical protein